MTLRMIQIATASLLTATLAGCMTTRHVWLKGGISDEQARREQAVCVYQAEAMCGNQYGLTELEAENRKRHFENLYNACMIANGYTKQTIQE